MSVPDLLPFLSEPNVGEFLPCTGRAYRVGSTDQAVQPAEHLPRALYRAKPVSSRRPLVKPSLLSLGVPCT